MRVAMRPPLLGAIGFALLAVAHASWAFLAIGFTPLLLALGLEAMGFALAAWGFARSARALASGLALVVLAEIAFQAAFFGAGEDALFYALTLTQLATLSWLAWSAWRGAPLRNATIGAALAHYAYVAIDLAQGHTFLLFGYLFSVPGYAAAFLATRPPASRGSSVPETETVASWR